MNNFFFEISFPFLLTLFSGYVFTRQSWIFIEVSVYSKVLLALSNYRMRAALQKGKLTTLLMIQTAYCSISYLRYGKLIHSGGRVGQVTPQ